jgi:hypothetical protein
MPSYFLPSPYIISAVIPRKAEISRASIAIVHIPRVSINYPTADIEFHKQII